MKPKLIVTIFLIFFSNSMLFSQEVQGPPPIFFEAGEKVKTFEKAILSQKIKFLLPILDKQFYYFNRTGDEAIKALDSTLESRTSILGINYSGLQSTDQTDLWKAILCISIADSLVQGEIIFTSEAKIRSLNMGSESFKSKKPRDTISIRNHRIDLLFSGHIFVKTKLGDEEGYFMIDNGTPGGALNKAGLLALGQKETDKKTRSLNADIELGGKMFDLHFSILKWQDKDYGYPDMKIFGVIGTNLLSAYNVTYDYIHSQLILDNIGVEPLIEINSDFELQWVNIQYGPQGHTFFKQSRIGNLYGLIHFDTGMWDDKLDFSSNLAKKAGIKKSTVEEIRIGDFKINNISWEVGRNFQEVHGKNVIGELGNLPFFNCIITTYPAKENALIRRNMNASKEK